MEDAYALPPGLDVLVDEMRQLDRIWEKWDRSVKPQAIAACNAVLAYLDAHKDHDIEWVRRATYSTLSGLYGPHPYDVVRDEIEEEDRRVAAMKPIRRWFYHHRIF